MSNFSEKLGDKKNLIIFWLVALLIVTLSFGAGYLLARQSGPAPIIIETHPR